MRLDANFGLAPTPPRFQTLVVADGPNAAVADEPAPLKGELPTYEYQ
jgi:hypothetical protein